MKATLSLLLVIVSGCDIATKSVFLAECPAVCREGKTNGQTLGSRSRLVPRLLWPSVLLYARAICIAGRINIL